MSWDNELCVKCDKHHAMVCGNCHGAVEQERDEARAYAEERNDEANRLQRHLNRAAQERDEARQQVDALALISANLVQYREQAEQTTASYREQLREARAEVERLSRLENSLPASLRDAHAVVEELRARLRTVAERQREADKTACFRAKFSITGSPDLRAVIFNAGCDSAAQKVGCTPLVTEGDK